MKKFIIIFFLAFFCYPAQAQILFNGSFEETYPNTQIPKFWTLNHGESVVYTLDSTTFYSGKKSLKMESNFSDKQLKEQAVMFPNGAGGLAYFNITHLLTQPFAKNKITISAFAKAENITEGTAGILGWANIRNNLNPIVIPMTTEISGSTDWKKITHTFQVPENAFDVFIHFRLLGKGKVWFDNLEISVNGKAIADKAIKSILTQKQLFNLRKNTFALNTDWASEDFTDLQNLKIADETRIIGLGEGTHGTSEYFKMKTRLIKYLVQNKGYTLIGFEAFLLECEAINKYILTGEGDPKQALKGLMFWCWNTKEVLALVEWLKTYNQTAKNKVKFVGIDGQFSLSALPTLKKYAQEIDENLLKEISTYFTIYEAFTKEFKFKPYEFPYKDSIDLAIVETKKLNEILAEKETYLLQKADREKVYRLLESAKILYQQMMCTKDFSNSRDVYYAENTSWFIDKKYPNEKIILWVHNWHIARNEENRKSMGFYLSEKYKDKYIPIGFASLEGTYTARGDKGIKQDNPAFKAENNSIENYLSQLNLPAQMLDLRLIRKEPKNFSYLNNGVFIREIGSDVEKGNQFRFLDVPKIFDFLIYFDKTKGSELLSRKEKQHTTAVWRNWGFRQTLKLVLYLEVGFLFDTFG